MKILIVACPVLGRLAPAALSGFSLAMLSPLSRPRHATFLPYLECTRLLAPSHSLSQCWFFCCSHVIFLCSLCLGTACPPLELAPLATSSPTWFISLVCTFQGSCTSQFWFVTESQAYYDSWFMNPVSRAPATTRESFQSHYHKLICFHATHDQSNAGHYPDNFGQPSSWKVVSHLNLHVSAHRWMWASLYKLVQLLGFLWNLPPKTIKVWLTYKRL